MEKERHVPPHANGRLASSMKPIAIACILTAGLFHFGSFGTRPFSISPYGSACHASVNNNSDTFEWNKLPPSKKLKWVSCYNNYECARLQVPLDYHDHGAGNAAIALVRIPAKTKDKHYKGPVLFNPGGPGASGVNFILEMGHDFQALLGDDYDIVGFDPRGIGYTTPVVDIFQTPLERAAWGIQNLNEPFINDTQTALYQIIARAQLVNIMVAEKAAAVAQHVNTAVVCRDMLSIANAHGFDTVQYWGFSYGSVLGSSFASLFPDKVGRLVIDGVVDAINYYETLWDNSLDMADASLEVVFEQCAASGEQCGLYESTASKVEDRYLRLVESITKNPVPVHRDGKITVITKKNVRYYLLIALYQPYQRMKTYFDALNSLEHGDGLPLANFMEEFSLWGFPKLKCECDAAPPLSTGGFESGYSVECSDGAPVVNDPEELYRHYERLSKVSYFADMWSETHFRCVDWKVKPKWQWRGPIGGNTSFPLLLVGNTEDPVTPHAKKMAKLLQDSGVVMQNSAGHCSLTATSFCTAKAIREYFREGILPAKGTVCEIESHMFQNKTENFAIATNEEDAKVLEAWRSLQRRASFASFLHVH